MQKVIDHNFNKNFPMLKKPFINTRRKRASLVLSNGMVFSGFAFGATKKIVGEVVFNTSFTGYQEILTDPSYYNQIIVFTNPHIGNVGINSDDIESKNVHTAGVIVRELSPFYSNWRAKISLHKFLKKHGVVGICDIDTRELTKVIREFGSMCGTIIVGEVNTATVKKLIKGFDYNENLLNYISTNKSIVWKRESLKINAPKSAATKDKLKIVVYDFGVKYQILRLLYDKAISVVVVPHSTTYEEILSIRPNGIVLSNGPGNPCVCHNEIANIKKFIDSNIPILGICLGCQLLALASGAFILKMKFGHHGANHPIIDIKTNKIYITSQNHNFVIDEHTLPNNFRITHRSLFDRTIQGIEHISKPIFGMQGHPEASPGPHDNYSLFYKFISYAKKK